MGDEKGDGDARSPQVRDEVTCVCVQLGREDGFRCGQAKDYRRNAESDGGGYCAAGGDERCEKSGKFRIL